MNQSINKLLRCSDTTYLQTPVFSEYEYLQELVGLSVFLSCPSQWTCSPKQIPNLFVSGFTGICDFDDWAINWGLFGTVWANLCWLGANAADAGKDNLPLAA